MALTSDQLKTLQKALLSGFPTKGHLEMLMRIELDTSLDAVAEADDHTLRIFKVITWAERTGHVRRLIDGAGTQNSDNPEVRDLMSASRVWPLESALATDPPANPGADRTPVATVGKDKTAHDYLTYIHARYQFLDFKGMGISDRVPLQLPVAGMYVPLKARVELPEGETWARELWLAGRKATEAEVQSIGERVSGPQPILDLLNRHDGLVILGDPGAGKTTFLKFLTVTLAQGQGAALGLDGRLPVLVPLSAYATALAQQDLSLQAFMGEYYRKRGIDLPIDQLIDQALASGQALIMLDGLDEIQALAQRNLVVERVEAFFTYQRTRGNRFIITSRIVGYRAVRPTAENLKECTLVDFDDDDILLFLEKWTQALEHAAKGAATVTQLEAAEEKAELLFALERNPGVRQLAANPLLLTILALMKRQGMLLPERRVQLYDQYVQTLLRTWNLSRSLDRRVARDLDVLETTRVLAPLALWMQETSPGAGLVKRERLRRHLESIYRARQVEDPEASARQLLRDARDYASLLLERGAGEYGFIHLTFQEYLAAVAVAQRGQSDLDPIVDLLAAHVDDPRWHEVSLLTIGHMGIVQQRDEAAGEVLMRLIERNPGKAGAAVVLAGEAVLDTWPGGVTLRCRNAIATALLATMTDSANLTPVVRARAGSILGALGDPRDLEEMLPVPGGPFIMGDDREKNERPRHKAHVEGFRIAKFPVTNQQYALFVAATDHAPPHHWRGKKPPRELNNHPVTNVAWDDARAYCAWLGTVRGEVVRLPTEAEWEKAARGRDGCEYPWGEAPDPNKANYRDSKIVGTSPVGCFPEGHSPYGCLDMAGNVWEWTGSLYRPYPYQPDDGREAQEGNADRTLRGGSWSDQVLDVRGAVRREFNPRYGGDLVGFRVLSPGS